MVGVVMRWYEVVARRVRPWMEIGGRERDGAARFRNKEDLRLPAFAKSKKERAKTRFAQTMARSFLTQSPAAWSVS